MQTKSLELTNRWGACALFLLCAVLVLLPDLSYSIDSPMGIVLCNASLMFQGNAGRGLATIGIAVVGVGAALGRVTWGMACMVGAGVGAVFGSFNLVTALGVATGGVCI